MLVISSFDRLFPFWYKNIEVILTTKEIRQITLIVILQYHNQNVLIGNKRVTIYGKIAPDNPMIKNSILFILPSNSHNTLGTGTILKSKTLTCKSSDEIKCPVSCKKG